MGLFNAQTAASGLYSKAFVPQAGLQEGVTVSCHATMRPDAILYMVFLLMVLGLLLQRCPICHCVSLEVSVPSLASFWFALCPPLISRAPVHDLLYTQHLRLWLLFIRSLLRTPL